MDHVHDPGADRLHDNLRAFALQEGEHVEVAVAFGGLRPEFAGDLHDWLHAEAIDLDLIEAVADVVKRDHVVVRRELVQELAEILDRSLHRNLVRDFAELLLNRPRRLLLQHFVHVVDSFVENRIGVAGVRFERPHLVARPR